MHRLIREALNITKELGPVVFVGAIAVFLQTKNTRESQDLDFAIAKPITNEELEKKGYRIINDGGKEKIYTPRNYKVDIYSDRPLNEIPIDTIIETSKDIEVNKKGDTVKAMGLEALILSKFRANRPDVDYEDLRALAIQRLKDVNGHRLRALTKGDYEFDDLMNTLRVLSR